MSPGVNSGLCWLLLCLSLHSFVEATSPVRIVGAQPPYFPPPTPVGPVRRALTDVQQLISQLINLPNIDKCIPPQAKIPNNLKLAIDDIVKRLTEIPQKLQCKGPSKKISQCRSLYGGDVYCIDLVEEDDITIVEVRKNDKVIKQTKVPQPPTEVLEPEFDKVLPRKDPVIKRVTKVKTPFPTGDILEIEVVEEDDIYTIIIKENDVPISNNRKKGRLVNPLSVIIEEENKYVPKGNRGLDTTPSPQTTKRTMKCFTLATRDIVCIEVIDRGDKVNVIIRKNGLVVTEEEDIGDISDVLNKAIKKYIPTGPNPTAKVPSEKPPTKKVTSCVIISEEERICVEVIQEDETITVITRRNDKIIDTREDTGDLKDILNKTIRKFTPTSPKPQTGDRDLQDVTRRVPNEKPLSKKTTKCVILATKETICVDVIEEDEKITVITRKNDKVIDTTEETGDIPDIFTKIFKKYIPVGPNEKPPVKSKKPRRTSKCVTLSNGDVICVETIEYPDKTIVKTVKNNEIVDESESTEEVTEIIENIIKKYTTPGNGKKTPLKRVRKCRILDSGDTVCIEVTVEEDFIIITTINNDVVVGKKKTRGNLNDVIEKEFDEYLTTIVTTEEIVGRIKTKCRILSTGEKYCVEVTEENGKLTVVVKKDNVIVNRRITKGDIDQILDEELDQYAGKTQTSQTKRGKSVTKCGGYENSDQYCVEVIDEENSYKVIVKKNNVVISTTTRDSTQPLTTVLNEEFGKYVKVTSTDVEASRTSRKCRTYANGDKVCVEVGENDGVKSVKTFKNGNPVRTRKTRDDLKDIYEKEFDDFKS